MRLKDSSTTWIQTIIRTGKNETKFNLYFLFWYKLFFTLFRSKEKNRRDRFKKNIDEEFDSFFEDSHGNNLKFFGFPKDVLDQFEQIMSSLGELDEFDGEPFSAIFSKSFSG